MLYVLIKEGKLKQIINVHILVDFVPLIVL